MDRRDAIISSTDHGRAREGRPLETGSSISGGRSRSLTMSDGVGRVWPATRGALSLVRKDLGVIPYEGDQNQA